VLFNGNCRMSKPEPLPAESKSTKEKSIEKKAG
jgi:hypothetical protein